MLAKDQLIALESAAQQAQACEAATGCPAALTVAQWALESGWGRYSPGNNCFGIKFYPGAFGAQKLATHEFTQGREWTAPLIFATFESLEKCFEKHAQLLTTGAPYRGAFARYTASQDLEVLVGDVAKAYATDPHYAETVLSIIHMAPVQAALMPATLPF